MTFITLLFMIKKLNFCVCDGCYEQSLQMGMMTSQYHYILTDLVSFFVLRISAVLLTLIKFNLLAFYLVHYLLQMVDLLVTSYGKLIHRISYRIMPLVFTSPPPPPRCEVLWWACQYFCLSVCLSAHNKTSKLSVHVFRNWIGPPLTTMQCIMYFRFCLRRRVFP